MKKISQLAVGFYAGIVTVAFLMLLYSFQTMKQTFEEITVKRINIVDDAGVNRMVISNQEKMEPPIVLGKKSKRAVNPAGIIFYNEKGDECGGIALSRNPKTNIYALALDYNNADAIGLLTEQDKNGGFYRSGLIINDKDHSGKVGSNTNRINLMTINGNSSLVINGPDEKARIVIQVDSIGNPTFKMLGNDGEVIKEFLSNK